MTMAAVGKVGAKAAAHGASGLAGNVGGGDNEELIIVMMVVSAGLIFIDHDRSGKPQDGNQFIALGIVGFFLLVLDQFWSELALAFAALFTVSIILNTPNGIPFIPSSTAPGAPNAPGQPGYGAAIVPVVNGQPVGSYNQKTGVYTP